MATAAIGKDLEKHLECGICFDRFCLEGPEEPKMLPCQHTYCKKCLGRLVTRAGPEDYKVTCPECKRETKIPGGDVTRLQSNFLINRLLSIPVADQSAASSLCEKHEGEAIKLFCETCDQSICRECAIEDHRKHNYTFIKDVFPAEKEKIMNSVRKVSTSIPVLKSAIESIQTRERKVKENVTTVSQEVDAFINQNIALLESKRKNLKQELERLSMTQMKQLSDQKESLSVSLGCAESGVKFAEQALARKSEVEILSMKNQIIQQMTELSAAAEATKLREHVVYKLEPNSPLNNESVGKMAQINEHHSEHTGLASAAATTAPKMRKHGSEQDEFVLIMVGGEPGVIYTTRAKQTCHFVISPRNNNKAAGERKDEVEVFINQRKQKVVTSNQDGSYSFSYRPVDTGSYVILIRINGSPTCGGPRHWEVGPLFSFYRYVGVFPSKCVFQVKQHSWKTTLLLHKSRDLTDKKNQIGVIHASGSLKSFWEQGRHISCDSNNSVLKTVASSVRDFQHGDVFVCYLNIDKGQLIIYNERTKQSDTFNNLKAAVSPLFFPEGRDFLFQL